jgi:hypothetical protein
VRFCEPQKRKKTPNALAVATSERLAPRARNGYFFSLGDAQVADRCSTFVREHRSAIFRRRVPRQFDRVIHGVLF